MSQTRITNQNDLYYRCPECGCITPYSRGYCDCGRTWEVEKYDPNDKTEHLRFWFYILISSIVSGTLACRFSDDPSIVRYLLAIGLAVIPTLIVFSLFEAVLVHDLGGFKIPSFFVFIIVCLIIGFAFTQPDEQERAQKENEYYETGYEEGYHEGIEEGYDDGYENGFSDGYSKAERDYGV